MKFTFWLTILAIFILWYIFGQIWLKDDNAQFNFSDRDKTMVFPTPKNKTIDPFSPSVTVTVEPTVQKVFNSSDSSSIKY